VVRAVGLTEVARQAGVSVGTVSNVLNSPDRVSEKTRGRVQQVIADLGYVRNEVARQLRIGHSTTIGMVVVDVANPFFTDLSAGVEDFAAESGLSVMLCNSGENREREARHLQNLEAQRVYGVLLTPVSDHVERIEQLRSRGTPVVLVDRGSTESQCSVSVDDVVGGRLAVAHLIEQEHQRIAFVGGPRSLRQVTDRLEGARAAVSDAGRPAGALTVLATEALTVAEGRRAGERLLAMSTGRRPTAAFCANDLLALGLLQQLTNRVRIPEDFAIVGYDDIDFAASAAVPLTSIRQPRRELGEEATRMLIDEVASAATHVHRQMVFDPELVIRQSSDHPRAGR
jgi:LacI family transcriptional regulator